MKTITQVLMSALTIAFLQSACIGMIGRESSGEPPMTRDSSTTVGTVQRSRLQTAPPLAVQGPNDTSEHRSQEAVQPAASTQPILAVTSRPSGQPSVDDLGIQTKTSVSATGRPNHLRVLSVTLGLLGLICAAGMIVVRRATPTL